MSDLQERNTSVNTDVNQVDVQQQQQMQDSLKKKEDKPKKQLKLISKDFQQPAQTVVTTQQEESKLNLQIQHTNRSNQPPSQTSRPQNFSNSYVAPVNNSLHKLADNPQIGSSEKIDIPKPVIKMSKKKKESQDVKEEAKEPIWGGGEIKKLEKKPIQLHKKSTGNAQEEEKTSEKDKNKEEQEKLEKLKQEEELKQKKLLEEKKLLEQQENDQQKEEQKRLEEKQQKDQLELEMQKVAQQSSNFKASASEDGFKVMINKQDLIDLILKKIQSQEENPDLSEEIQKIKNREIRREMMAVPQKGGNKQHGNYQQGQGGQYNKQKKTVDMQGQYRSQQQQQQGVDFSIRQPIDEEKDRLMKVSNVWIKAQQENTKNDEELKRQKNLRLKLNILTAENFDTVKLDLLEIAKHSKESCDKLVAFILEKSWTEPKFTKTYAQLCYFMQGSDKLYFNDPVQQEQQAKKKKSNNAFKSSLLSKIQDVFEGEEDILKTKVNYDQMDHDQKVDYHLKKKKRILGNVNFIGELLLVQVISKRVIEICNSSMMTHFINEYQSWILDNDIECKRFEDQLEGIITLNQKVGKHMDVSEKKKAEQSETLQKQDQNYNKLDSIIAAINIALEKGTTCEKMKFNIDALCFQELIDCLYLIGKSAKISSRSRCLIENMIAKRDEGWKDTIFDTEGPMKKKDLHNQHHKELMAVDKRAEEFYQQQQGYDKYDDGNYGGKNKRNHEKMYQAKEQQQGGGNRGGGSRKNDKQRDQRQSNNNQQQQQQQSHSQQQHQYLPTHTIDEQLKEKFGFLTKGTAKTTTYNKEINAEEEQFNSYTQDEFYADIKDLLKKSQVKIFFESFYKLFYDDKIVNVQKRVFIFENLVDDKIITIEQFLSDFNAFLLQACEIYSDAPQLVTALASIYGSFVKNAKLQYQDFKIEVREDEDFNEMYQEFIQQFIEDTWKYLKANDINAIFEEDLKKLTKSLKSVSDQWFEKMKSYCK